MTTTEIVALVASIVLPMAGGFLWLGLKFGRVEGALTSLPTRDWVEDKIEKGVVTHREGCPAYRETTTGGPALPPARG